MTDLDALLAGIVAHPHEHVRWLIVADWLDDHGFADRAELLRLHRMLIDTCCEPDAHPDRAEWQARIVELIDQGVTPCVPQHTLMLPGGVPLVGHFIPPGSFLMGGDQFDDEKPIHTVTLTKGRFIGIHPVTEAQWRAAIGTDTSSSYQGDCLPMENISWEGAVAFCAKVAAACGHSVRLPTEAEWEYACRAGTTTHFHWGNVPDARRMNYAAEPSPDKSPASEFRNELTDVCAFAANPWGLFDCHGNVSEWCSDYCDEDFYRHSPPADPECSYDPEYSNETEWRHLVRGGSYYFTAVGCRSSTRELGSMNAAGFRVVFALD